MKRLLHALDSLGFWIAVFVLAVIFVFAYAWSNNRAAVTRNQDVLDQHVEVIAHLCETIHVLDVLTLQQARLTRETLRKPEVPRWAQDYLASREALLLITHDELSQSRGCVQVE